MKHTIHNQDTLHPTATETDLYFYHSDHLGSASWITDATGTPIQHIQYCPYGEPFVDQHPANIYQERFTFTGKERDAETGYHYFGARYLDADWMTGWLSVDPLSDKYPKISPYSYCVGNPMKLVDPDGELPWPALVVGFKNKGNISPPTLNRTHPTLNIGRPHHGIDMPAKSGAKVLSAASGTVTFSGTLNGYGNTVVVNHGKGYYSLYAHLSSLNVEAGESISEGGVVGAVGNTGVSGGAHLHLEYIFFPGREKATIQDLMRNKSDNRINPMEVRDLQKVINGEELALTHFVNGKLVMLGDAENIHKEFEIKQSPKPSLPEKLKASKLPIFQTIGDILDLLETY